MTSNAATTTTVLAQRTGYQRLRRVRRVRDGTLRGCPGLLHDGARRLRAGGLRGDVPARCVPAGGRRRDREPGGLQRGFHRRLPGRARAGSLGCTPTWAETLELRREIYTACRVIDGLSVPGLGCSVSATCKRPDGTATAECVKNKCVAIEILPEGATCPFPSGAVSVCAAGLACSAEGPGVEGSCVPAIATGQSLR